MRKILLFCFTAFCFCYCDAQTWDWVHAEPNGPAFYTGEDDATHHVKTDANGNAYVLGSFLGSLYLNNNFITNGNGSYLAKYDPAGNLLWYRIIGPDYANTSGDTYIKASDLIVNSTGIYITGKYNYSFGYRYYLNNCNIVVTTSKAYKIGSYSFTSSIYDIGLFVTKLTFDGAIVWNKTATDAYPDQYNCSQPETCGNCSGSDEIWRNPVLASDQNNNVTVAFNYSSPHSGFAFDGTLIPSSRTPNTYGQGLNIISLNSDGGVRWSNDAVDYPNIAGDDVIMDIAADNNGNIFLVGQTSDGTYFGNYTIEGSSQSRYIAKISSSGEWQFVKKLTNYMSVSTSQGFYGSFDVAPNLITADANNNIYILVNLASAAGSPQYILGTQIPDPSNGSIYLVRMTNNGNPDWIKKFGFTPFNGLQYGMGIQYANNDLYITGTMNTGTAEQTNYHFGNLFVPSANPHGSEYLVARANVDGDFKWATTFSGFVVGGLSVAVNGDNIYTVGYYRRQIYSLGSFNADVTATTDYTTTEPFFGKLKDQYIRVGAIFPTTLCPGASFTIPFTSYGLTLSNNNSFTAQISDVNGDFTNAVNIGSITSTGSGSINATLPANLPMGSSGYKIRIVSSDLLNTGLPYYAYADVDYTITVGNQTFYQDGDGDGYGNPAVNIQTCSPPSGYVTNNLDCNDADAAINPNTVWYLDADNDAYYTGSGITSCTSPGPGYKYLGLLGGDDCDDNNAAIHSQVTYYQDADNDGFGDPNTTTNACSITAPSGYVNNSNDCDDTKASISPNTIWYLDADNDGYYTGSGITSCTSPGTGYKHIGLIGGRDCDDNNSNVNAGTVEICGNGIDDNCDGQIDENCLTSLPALSIEDKTVYESEGVVAVTVTLDKPASKNVKVAYVTVDGTATAVSKGKGRNPTTGDYIVNKGNLMIPAGVLSATISVQILNDGITEGDEQFVIQLTNASNATIADATGGITIKDGVPPAITLTNTKQTIPEQLAKTGGIKDLSINVFPNPAAHSFNISLQSKDINEKIKLRVTDILGRIIDIRDGLHSGQTLNLGENYRAGIYIIAATQNNNITTIKFVKIPN